MEYWGVFVATFFGVLSFNESFQISLTHGRRLQNSTTLTTLIKSSLMMCHQSCLARRKCKSFQLDRRFNLCYLSSSDTSTPGTNLTIAPGLVYSEKKKWTETSRSQICEMKCSISDECNPYDGNNVCKKSECGEPQLIDSNSEIRGSMRNIGARVLHVCTNNPRLYNTSECLQSGQWSNVSLTCLSECRKLPAIKDGSFLLDISGRSYAGATAILRCNTGFEPKTSSERVIKCLETGLWADKGSTCEPVDCGMPPKVPNSHFSLMIPNNTTYGATAVMSCNDGYKNDSVPIACTGNGKWNFTVNQLTCVPYEISESVLVTNLTSTSYQIVNNGNKRYWHLDGSLSLEYFPVTVKWQSTDNFCHFRFEKMSDKSYKIKNLAVSTFVRDVDGTSPCKWLNGLLNVDEDYMRFWVYQEPSGMYRIISKATKRYVRVDENRYVSSIQNKKDEFSLFMFRPV